MIRLIIAFLCALGLAFSPVAANAAAAPPASMSECAMDGEMPHLPADHSKMECCTPACHAPATAALVPVGGIASEIPGRSVLDEAPAKELASLRSSGLDPPPRA